MCVLTRIRPLRLATAVGNRSDQMSDTIALKEHTFQFEVGNITNKNAQEVRKVPDHPEIEDLVFAI